MWDFLLKLTIEEMAMNEIKKIKDIKIISGKRFIDERGELIKPYSTSFINIDNPFDVKEVWFTKSKCNVIRGMHLQSTPYECDKIVSVIEGRILDVILDLRKNSKSYGEIYEIELSSNSISAVFIPKGCCHGYRVLSDQSIVMYMANEINVSKYDVGIKWNSFNYDWGIDTPIISEKDNNLKPFIYGETFY